MTIKTLINRAFKKIKAWYMAIWSDNLNLEALFTKKAIKARTKLQASKPEQQQPFTEQQSVSTARWVKWPDARDQQHQWIPNNMHDWLQYRSRYDYGSESRSGRSSMFVKLID